MFSPFKSTNLEVPTKKFRRTALLLLKTLIFAHMDKTGRYMNNLQSKHFHRVSNMNDPSWAFKDFAQSIKTGGLLTPLCGKHTLLGLASCAASAKPAVGHCLLWQAAITLAFTAAFPKACAKLPQHS